MGVKKRLARWDDVNGTDDPPIFGWFLLQRLFTLHLVPNIYSPLTLKHQHFSRHQGLGWSGSVTKNSEEDAEDIMGECRICDRIRTRVGERKEPLYLINLMTQPFFPMMSVYHLFHLDIPRTTIRTTKLSKPHVCVFSLSHFLLSFRRFFY